jgi:pyruvate ferredoxin oxidoreductase gamma subunit/2-oxoisovalerate ferredoxin oxidoreductase gamma subunit
VVASRILALAAFAEGLQVQSFPRFGVERRGAPVETFLRIATDKILIRSEVTTPDIVVVLDLSLIDTIDFTQGLKQDDGMILINTSQKPEALELSNRFKVSCVNASKIAADLALGSVYAPVVNTAMCGAFAKISSLVGIDAVCDAIISEIPVKPDNNCKAARTAYATTYI